MFLRILDKLEEILIASLIAAATLLIFVSVLQRYAIGVPFLSGLRGSTSTGTVLRSQLPLPRPFTLPLTIPPVLAPARTDASTDYYQITQKIASYL